ncbi:monosaccharide ABC transporter ATP-binding protein (CUT2 family) [Microcella alkaliphila]|uniref:Monosaccharide ABC transporter ATP-binding protein (CUT2 family) n=1 Tax=Microcella alkaliphila TaxID=279828 RepID=A0A4Q7TZC7_9MICO|nr:ATP-binding cassette domain-containing protein [Microcella alkaliphila]RZT66465.1 monosaccharide ABC transporter ATP-binding protein (CUT2 family) [Microcella alkaliphila]
MSNEATRPEIAIAGRHLAKRFGHVQALSDASITVPSGKVVALFGDNGAGKSTFLKLLLGIYQKDAGELIIGDEQVELHSVRDAQQLGVDCVYQDLALAPDLSVVDNMFLGHELTRPGALGWAGFVDRKEMEERADAALRNLSIKLPSLRVAVQDLSGGQRQAVAVARAVMWSRTAVLMDEPTAALGARQSEIVCDLMRSVAESGLGVLVVSHDLPRALKVADTVNILWRGKTALEAPAAGLTVPEVVSTMVGYQVGEAA